MNIAMSWMIGLSMLAPAAAPPARTDDAPRLREMLYDRRHVRPQSQAALLLVIDTSAEAAEIVRNGLKQSESPEVFHALCTALTLRRDHRFNEELFAALIAGPTERRQHAADALAHLIDDKGVARLKALATSATTESEVRRAAVLALGRSGRKTATAVLIDLISTGAEAPRRDALEVLSALTGHNLGADSLRWQAWWAARKGLSDTDWMHELFLYQTSKSRRLEAEVERARSEVARLHQQLYSRLPAADRLGHLQATMNHEDATIRALVVTWCVEMLPVLDAAGQRAIADVLLDLARDSTLEVQRAAVLALGRVNDGRVCARLRTAIREAPAPVRAAAARALTQQACLPRPEKPETRAVQRSVVPALQKALEDPALEVVVEAAEDLGTLGLPEAVPVLTGLLKHPSEPVRQTAAQALERIADASVVDALLAALEDTSVGVRFSVVGALGHAATESRPLPLATRARLFARLEDILVRDTDPGVRSRAANVLGECATPAALPALWKRAQAAEDTRVQEKAWSAFVAILARSANLETLQTWERTLIEAHQETRQLQLLAAVVEAWKKRGEASALVIPAMESLVQAQLQQGKWSAALPLTRELLAQSASSDVDVTRRLRWFLAAGEQALKEGNRAEALRVVQDALTFLPRSRSLAAEFERLEKQAQK